jgi:RNA polymerase sigma factor (sigma-70 family)
MLKRPTPEDRRERFDQLYTTHYAAIYAYAYRRLRSESDAVPDVVADVFAVAWRKLEQVPDPPQDRLWLYGVARHRVLHAQRSNRRYLRLQQRLRDQVRTGDDAGLSGSGDLDVQDAVARLRPGDREAVMLTMWEGLSHAEAAAVIGCSVNAVALRVSRAKRRLRAELDPTTAVTGHGADKQEASS